MLYFTGNILVCVRFCCANAVGRLNWEHKPDALWFYINCFQVQTFSHTHTDTQKPHTHLWWRKPLSYITRPVGLNSSSPECYRSSSRLIGRYPLSQTWSIIPTDVTLIFFGVFFTVFYCLDWNAWGGSTQQTQWPLTPPRGHDAVRPEAVLHPGRPPGRVRPLHHGHVHQREGGPSLSSNHAFAASLLFLIFSFFYKLISQFFRSQGKQTDDNIYSVSQKHKNLPGRRWTSANGSALEIACLCLKPDGRFQASQCKRLLLGNKKWPESCVNYGLTSCRRENFIFFANIHQSWTTTALLGVFF